MKLLCVIDSLGPGGSQRQLVELALGFKEKGNIVSFLTYYNIPYYKPVLENAGILVTCIQEPIYIKRLFKMRSFIRSGKFDIVLSFLEGPNFICEIAGIPFRKWKLIIGERSANPEIAKSAKLIVYRWFHFFADYIVANSFANMNLVRKVNPFLSRSKCKVIYNSIDLNRWKPDENFKFKRNSKIKLIIAARQIYQKNINGLLDAIMLLSKDEREKIHIEWYGETLKESFIDDFITKTHQKIKLYCLESVISLKPVTNEITRIIQESDTVGLFSFYEGFPNSICEGMACGKPIIASFVSDIPRLLSHNTNLLCDPGDPQSIKRAISYLINLSNVQLSEIGLRNEKIAREKFEKKLIIAEYMHLFNMIKHW